MIPPSTSRDLSDLPEKQAPAQFSMGQFFHDAYDTGLVKSVEEHSREAMTAAAGVVLAGAAIGLAAEVLPNLLRTGATEAESSVIGGLITGPESLFESKDAGLGASPLYTERAFQPTPSQLPEDISGLSKFFKPAATTSDTTLDLSYEKTTIEEFVQRLKANPGIERLNLSWTDVGDGRLQHLSLLPNLKELSLRCSEGLEGDTLSDLRHAPQLEKIHLFDSDVTDVDLRHLANVPGLKELDLGETIVGDSGLKDLTHVPDLEELSLNLTDVTDAGLAHVRQVPLAKGLFLLGTDVTDAGVERLAPLTNLEELDLARTKFSDAGVLHLDAFNNLRQLLYGGSQVTETGADYLRVFSPEVKAVNI